MVCIIDDREDVWKMAPNLVHVRPYRFFDGTADINAPPEASKTADADDRSLTEGGISVRPAVRRNIRVVRVPKKPLSDDGRNSRDSAEESSPDITSSENLHANSVSVTVTECEHSAGASKQTVMNATPSSSDLVSDKALVETSASDDSDSVVQSFDSADGRSVERNSEDKKIAKKDSTSENAASDLPTSESVDAAVEEKTEEYNEFVEWEDLDDYLVYLEDILRRIHTAYFELYDQMRLNDCDDATDITAAPDLKTIVPYVRRKVLKGARIVLSGVCPLGTDPTTCRIYRVAESLGAVVQSSVVSGSNGEATTHVVAARPGTEKVKAAVRQKSVWIVNPDWIWTCADRWEWVDERLYPLNDETSARFLSRDSPDPAADLKRKVSGKKLGPALTETDSENNGELGLYSLVTLSKEDISGMDAEVEKLLDESSESDDENDETETCNSAMKENRQICGAEDDDDAVLRKQVLSSYSGCKRKFEESSDEESLSGDFPKGWKDRSRKQHIVSGDDDKPIAASENNGDDDDDNGCEVKSQSDNSSNQTSTDEDFNESVGSIDEEIAAAVEKEFLS